MLPLHVLDLEIQEWQKFRRALRKEDQQVFDQLFEKVRLHVEAGVTVSRPWTFETILKGVQDKGKRDNCGLSPQSYL